ncbi:MAG: hypothetical protein J5737_07815 [Bacteroidales bacterium]|nr:hypothetical protein [Bacteroidales bacterium]
MEEYNRIKSQYSKFNEPWQSSEVDELKTMAADNVPVGDIAMQLQRTPNSVKMKLKSLGLYTAKPASKPWSNDDEAKLVQLYNNDVPFEDMAQEFGRSVGAIISRLVQLRVKLFNQQQQ